MSPEAVRVNTASFRDLDIREGIKVFTVEASKARLLYSFIDQLF